MSSSSVPGASGLLSNFRPLPPAASNAGYRVHGACQAHVHVAGPAENAEESPTARRGVRIHICADLDQSAFHLDSPIGVILASSKAAARRPCGRDLWGLAPRYRASASYWAGRMSAEQARTEEDL